MALTVEDGSGVAGANSYVSLVGFRAFADARGYTVPTDDTEAERLVVRAMDYIESFRNRFRGKKTDPAQGTQFPRTGVYLDGSPDMFPEDQIPIELVNAQSQAAVELVEWDLMESVVEPTVRQEFVGPISTTYAVGSADWEGAQFPKVDAWLNPLLSGCFGIPVVRV